MSVNLYKDGELQILAGASEIPRWSGTQAEFNALDKNSLADGTYVEITDDMTSSNYSKKLTLTFTGSNKTVNDLFKFVLDSCNDNVVGSVTWVDEDVYGFVVTISTEGYKMGLFTQGNISYSAYNIGDTYRCSKILTTDQFSLTGSNLTLTL